MAGGSVTQYMPGLKQLASEQYAVVSYDQWACGGSQTSVFLQYLKIEEDRCVIIMHRVHKTFFDSLPS
jgi:hypothetical protein